MRSLTNNMLPPLFRWQNNNLKLRFIELKCTLPISQGICPTLPTYVQPSKQFVGESPGPQPSAYENTATHIKSQYAMQSYAHLTGLGELRRFRLQVH